MGWIVGGIFTLIAIWTINEVTDGWVFDVLFWLIGLAVIIAMIIGAGFLLHLGWSLL